MQSPATALLIIDMQKGMREPAAGRRNNLKAEEFIARLLGAWRNVGAPIVRSAARGTNGRSDEKQGGFL
jgi:nicotinamidase-related amidase